MQWKRLSVYKINFSLFSKCCYNITKGFSPQTLSKVKFFPEAFIGKNSNLIIKQFFLWGRPGVLNSWDCMSKRWKPISEVMVLQVDCVKIIFILTWYSLPSLLWIMISASQFLRADSFREDQIPRIQWLKYLLSIWKKVHMC